MATKLSDSEFAERARAGNRQRADRRRGRLAQSGYQQLLVWMPADLRNQIDRVATERATTVTEATALIVRAGLAALAEPPRPTPSVDAKPAPESLPLFQSAHTEPATKPAKPDYTDRDRLIVQFRGEGLGYEAIRKRLADAGILAGTGNPVSKTTVKAVLQKAGLVEKEDAN